MGMHILYYIRLCYITIIFYKIDNFIFLPFSLEKGVSMYCILRILRIFVNYNKKCYPYKSSLHLYYMYVYLCTCILSLHLKYIPTNVHIYVWILNKFINFKYQDEYKIIYIILLIIITVIIILYIYYNKNYNIYNNK